MHSPRWTLITVTYNSAEHILQNWAERARDYRWIVVDNGSTDETLSLAARFADTVIENGENLGFSKANNIGLDAVDSEFVAFVNPDVRVAGDAWQRRLADTASRTGGLVAPQLVNPDGSTQANARGLPYLSAKIRNRIAPLTHRGLDYARADLEGPTYCAWVMGAAVAGQTSTIHAVGGWDDAYFLYYEDHEIGLRAWSRGVPVVLDPAVRWQHSWERATTRLDLAAWRFEFQSMRTFYAEHRQLLLRRRTQHHASDVNRRYANLTSKLWRPVDSSDEDQS